MLKSKIGRGCGLPQSLFMNEMDCDRGKMNKKYFFFDVDGTLATGITAVAPDSAVRCLERLRENGHFTAIATGRLQRSAAIVAGRYGFCNFVADGGHSLTIDNKIVEMYGLPIEPCIALIDRLVAAGIPWAATIENQCTCITSDERYLAHAPKDYFPVEYDPSFRYREMKQVYKLYLVCTPEEQKRIDFGGLTQMRYDDRVLLIEPIHKQRGIRRMLDILGVADQDVVVFGDGTNDIEMFEQGWKSIAMGNACDELKARADYITTSVDQDGLWNACKHFGWI